MTIAERLHELEGRDVGELLSTPVVAQDEKQRLASFLAGARIQVGRKEDLACAGLTIGDLLYDVSRLDPDVMAGADFARAADLSDIFKFSRFAERIVGLEEDLFQGNVSQIQGYVAERLVAQHLQSQGYEVTFPEISNQEGWDLLVNGDPYQVKCLADAAGVHEHVARFPDIPVFVNAELAEELDGVDGVFPVAAVSHEAVEEATRKSLESGAEVVDFEIPMIAVTIASARNVYAMVQGRTTLIHAFQNVVLDTAGRTVGGIVGSKALGAAGLLLGPYGFVVGGLLGAVVGGSQGRRLSSWFKANFLCADQEAATDQALRKLLNKAAAEADVKRSLIEQKTHVLSRHLKDRGPMKNRIWADFEWRLDQELSYLKGKIEQFLRFGKAPRDLDPNGSDLLLATAEGTLLTVQAGIPPHAIRGEYSHLSKAIESLKKIREKYLLK